MSDLGKQLIEGMQNALAYTEGRPVSGTRSSVIQVPAVDVRALRRRLELTQKSFAATFGFPLSSISNWEQGTRHPDRAARILLAVIDRHPETVRDTLAALERQEEPPKPTRQISP